MERKPISPEEAYDALGTSSRWIVERTRIYRDYRFADFKSALRFVNAAANVAGRVGHHPNILIHEYHFVRIETYDHLTGGFSTKDLELIRAIDRLKTPRA